MRVLLLICLLLTGCAGFQVPFTNYNAAHWMFKSDHDSVNSDCIEVHQFQAIAKFLETRHLEFLRSHDDQTAVNIKEFKEVLGTKCQPLLVALTTEGLQKELFGTSAVIPNPEKLRELGGLLFEYHDVQTDAGLRLTLHIQQEYTGPDRRLVAIYQLTDGKVIHLQYAGKDDVAHTTLHWPVAELFGIIVKEGFKAGGM